jgi:hypothetical protein
VAKPFEKQLEPFQRDAAARAKLDYGLSPAEVSRRAGEGILKSPDGEVMAAFAITADYVRKLASDLDRARQGKNASPLAKLPPKDAVEALRIRLVNLADHELAHLEKQRTGKRDPAKVREWCRTVREIAALPVPKDDPPAAPGLGERSERVGATRTGSTGALLAAMRGSRPPEDGVAANGDS